MTFSLRLTHQIALVVLLPLLIELGLLSAMLMTLFEIDTDRKAENISIKTLQAVNNVLNGVAKCGNFLLFNEPTPDQMMSLEFIWQKMKEEQLALKDFVSKEHIKSHRTSELIASVDKLIEGAEQFDVDFSQELSIKGGTLSQKLKPLSGQIAESGALAISEQLERRKRIAATMDEHQKQLEKIVGYGTTVSVVVALCSAFYLLARFWFGLRILMANTTNIALGRPLVPRLKGNDELARMDKLIHSMSADLNRAREKERALLDNASVIVCSCDENLRIMEINHVVLAVLGYDEQEIIGGILSSLMTQEDRDRAVERLELCLAAPQPVTFELRLRHKDKRIVVTEMSAEWSQAKQRFFLTIQDISERKEFERQKAEVMEIISEDLRTPLALILENLNIISGGSVGTLTERGVRLSNNATLSVSSLMSLVGDLVDIERFESDSLVLNYGNEKGEDLLQRSIEMVRSAADKKHLTISTVCKNTTDDQETSADVDLEVDGERVIRVLVNLLGNAIKFSPDSASIECACISQGTGRDTMARFHIKDHGPGIPSDKLDVVFEKFKQAGHDTKEEKSGSGLGLAICRAIVEAHHGSIGVDSVEGEGATFWFAIPIVEQEIVSTGSHQIVTRKIQR